MTACEALAEIVKMVTEIRHQDFPDVHEIKEKLVNVQDLANAAIAENC